MSDQLWTQLRDGIQAQLAHSNDEGAARALAIAEAAGLPAARTEGWRYSPLRLLARALRPAADRGEAAPIPDLAMRVPGESDLPDFKAGPAQTEDQSRGAGRAFAWLARASGCRLLTLSGRSTKPVYLNPLIDLDSSLPHRHQQVQIAAGADLTVIEHYRGDQSGSFANLLQQISLGEGAVVHWLRLVEAGAPDHLIVRSEFDLAAGARLIHHSLELGGAWSRHDLQFRLAGEQAELISRGLLPMAGKRHADTQLEVIHALGNTRSQMGWRGVAADRSRAVFNGRILIQAGADGSDAALNTASLLLSPHAEIDAKPELEIYADAVKAAHGAAIGQLDPQALFYMRSRGLPEAQARQLLMASFCRHALEDLPADLIAAIEPRVDLAIDALNQGEKA